MPHSMPPTRPTLPGRVWKFLRSVVKEGFWGLWRLLTFLGAVVGVNLLGAASGVFSLGDPLAIVGVLVLVALAMAAIGGYRAWDAQERRATLAEQERDKARSEVEAGPSGPTFIQLGPGAELKDSHITDNTMTVTSHQQTGGVTAGHVTISAPQPAARGRVVRANEPHDDGRFLTQAIVDLDASYAAQRLRVDVRGSAITRLDVGVLHGGMTIVDRDPDKGLPALATRTVVGPLSTRYQVSVFTAQPDDLLIEATLET